MAHSIGQGSSSYEYRSPSNYTARILDQSQADRVRGVYRQTSTTHPRPSSGVPSATSTRGEYAFDWTPLWNFGVEAVQCIKEVSATRLQQVTAAFSQFPISGFETPVSLTQSLVVATRNPKNRDEALRLLNVPEDQANDRVVIDERYQTVLKKLEGRLPKLSGPLAAPMKLLIDDCHIAYQTLTNPTRV